MAGYNYAKFISDFGGRTLENIPVIDDLRANDIAGNKKSKEEIEKEHHEVTQLINSLFGMIIVPYEKYKFRYYERESANSISEHDLKRTSGYLLIVQEIVDLEKKGKLHNSYNDHYIVGSFIKHLRNALAHSGDHGLHFTPVNQKKVINSIIFYDCDGPYEFCVELSVNRVRKLIPLIFNMYKEIEDIKEVDDLAAYNKDVESKRRLMSTDNDWARRLARNIDLNKGR